MAPAVAKNSTARRIARERNPLKKAFRIIGPGFITGISDDDPAGIGTYAVAGATFGPALLWTALATFPLMSAVQNICARLGMVTGRGLAGIIRARYSRWILYPVVISLLVANTVNIGADLAAIADAAGLIAGARMPWLVVPIGVALVLVQILGGYGLIEKSLKWLGVALLAYVIDVVIIRPDVGETVRATFVPTLSADPAFITMLLAILGTTISPYLFFWQASQEVEEQRSGRQTPGHGTTTQEIRLQTLDVNVGMAFSNVIFYFIVLATGSTLYLAGDRNIETAADAAEALRPVAGDLAGLIFGVGIIGAGLLAIPVLSGSAAYAVSETFGWKFGLNRRWHDAKGFYLVIGAATLIGAGILVTPISPVDALVASAVLNGIVAPPLLVILMLASRDRKVMGRQRIGPLLTWLGWITTAVMSIAVIAHAVLAIGG